MQNRQRRILGMTAVQLIVLACLGLTAIGAMAFAARLILADAIPVNAPLVQPTLEVQATAIPPTFTPLPTFTPILPTLTPTATTYASLIPDGWQQYKYQQVELWMPAEFVKKSMDDDLIYAERESEDGNGFHINVNLTNETSTTATLDEFIQQGVLQFTPSMTFLEKRKFEIGTYEVLRLKIQVILFNVPIGEALYFIKDGSTVWILTGASHYNEYRDWLPIFDQIAHTFRINP